MARRIDRLITDAKTENCPDASEFVWMNYHYGTPFSLPLSRAVAVRLLYFGTACADNGIIQREKLGSASLTMDRNQQTAFFRQTLQSMLLRREGDAYSVSRELICWGEDDQPFDRIRVFSHRYRTLCEGTHSQVELNQIHYFLQMIPYLNPQTNILSHDRTGDGSYMTFCQFCKAIGYGTSHASKLKPKLAAFRVCDELVVGFFHSTDELNPTGNHMVLNPALFYGGDLTGDQRELTA